jgi:hypothetical protein
MRLGRNSTAGLVLLPRYAEVDADGQRLAYVEGDLTPARRQVMATSS